MPKPEVQKPEMPKPGMPKPEVPKPEVLKPAIPRLECQGCTCGGSAELHPATTLQDCIHGCSVIELVCPGRDIIPTTSVLGLGFGGQPKSIPKDCTIRTIADGGMLTGKPASGCAKDAASSGLTPR
ncbi:hypothetical protein [Bradyrhizobium sp.]|uniref:hypothetical protein n=1 Tax=Bradyrhizobium sp. TaxID=376 RepID=UPI003C49D205